MVPRTAIGLLQNFEVLTSEILDILVEYQKQLEFF